MEVNHALLGKMEEYKIPYHMQQGLHDYIVNKIPPGGFLHAVLKNNLRAACEKADSINQTHLFDYVNFLYNEAPRNCWGSEEEVEAWLERIPPTGNDGGDPPT